MRILIVDDHVIFRAGLKQLLLEEFPGAEVDEAGDNISAMKKIREVKWDVVLLDINLPGKNGVDLLKSIKEVDASLPVLILSMYSEEQYAVRAMRAGAGGYLTKEVSPEVLTAAIKKVVVGGKYITPSLAETIAEQLHAPHFESLPHKLLSDREYDIFIKLASGKTVSEIADLLLLSVKTISTYRSRILSKMQMKNNADLMQYAVRNQLLIGQ